MKKGLKICGIVILCLYLIIVVFTTAFLLNRNQYGVSQFLDKSLLFVEDKNLEPDFKEKSLLFIGDVKDEDLKEGDMIFYYDTHTPEHKIKYTEIKKREENNGNEMIFTTKDNSLVSGQYILGTKSSTTALNMIGQFLYVIQSKWGFLFIVVFPLFLAFIWQIYAIYKELKAK